MRGLGGLNGHLKTFLKNRCFVRRGRPTIFLPPLDDDSSESDDHDSDRPDVSVLEGELLSRGKWN